MDEFLCEQIEVEKDVSSPTPVRIRWRGHNYTVTRVEREWVDSGFGDIPERSRKWFNRRHRRYYIVRTTSGEVFEIYLDYANRARQTWWLVKKLQEG